MFFAVFIYYFLIPVCLARNACGFSFFFVFFFWEHFGSFMIDIFLLDLLVDVCRWEWVRVTLRSSGKYLWIEFTDRRWEHLLLMSCRFSFQIFFYFAIIKCWWIVRHLIETSIFYAAFTKQFLFLMRRKITHGRRSIKLDAAKRKNIPSLSWADIEFRLTLCTVYKFASIFGCNKISNFIWSVMKKKRSKRQRK